MSNLIRHQVKC